MHCPEPWLDATTVEVRRWVVEHPAPTGTIVVPMTDVPVERVAEAFSTYFIWAHALFGTVRVDALPDYWAAYSAELDPHLSMLCLSGDEIVAFSLVTPDAWQGRTMIVSETVHADQPDGDALLAATVAASLDALGRRGVRLVELEGHDTDPHSPALVAGLPRFGGDPMTCCASIRCAEPDGRPATWRQVRSDAERGGRDGLDSRGDRGS